MGILDKYIQENNITENNNNDIETVNIALKVTAYEDNFFVGIRLDTKESIKVKMRDVEQKGNNKRPEVQDFANKHSKVSAPAGQSTVLLESCYEESEGIWNARWAKVLSSPKNPSFVTVVDTNVEIKNYQESSYLQLSAIKSITEVKTMDELLNELYKIFTPSSYRIRNEAIIRYTDTDGDSYVTSIQPAVTKDDNQVLVMSDPQISTEGFDNTTNMDYIMARDMLAKEDVKVEVIYVSKLFMGSDTNKKILESKFETDSIKKEYGHNEYKKTIITLRKRPDGSMFATSVKPLINNKKAVNIKTIGEK